MPGSGYPGRPGGELDEPLLDMIFGGRAVPPDAPPEMHELARTLAALAGPAEPGELAGEAAARAAFRFASPAGISPAAPRVARHGSRRPARHGAWRPRGRRSRRPAWGSSSAAAAALVVVVAVLGSAAAAYTGVLPGPLQQIAHRAVGAPAPHNDVSQLAAASQPRRDTGRGSAAASHPASGPAGSAGAAQANGLRPLHAQPPGGQWPAYRACTSGPRQPRVMHGPPRRHHWWPPPWRTARCPYTPYIRGR